MSYVNVHNHSQYSLLDGFSSVKSIVLASKDYSCPAVAITDHGNLHAVPEFHDVATKHGQKPIIGCEVYLAPTHPSLDGKRRYHHLILLAKNRAGYKNLCRLATLASTSDEVLADGHTGFYYKPRIDFNWLADHREGLIVSSACVVSELSRRAIDFYAAKDKNLALQNYLEVIERYKSVFGEDYYLEVMHDELTGDIGEQQRMANEMVRRWAPLHGVKIIGTCDSHYTHQNEHRHQQTILDLSCGQKYYDPAIVKRMAFEGKFWFKNPDEYVQEFDQDTANNTLEIAAKVEIYSPFEDKFVLPAVKLSESVQYAPGAEVLVSNDPAPCYSELVIQAIRGFKKLGARGKLIHAKMEEYTERFDHELSVINGMEHSAYLLACTEIINFARGEGIPVGPGRGSSSGSLICYCLGITQLDPFRFGLIFERFLNPGRITMPDIDMDFSKLRRQEIISFVRERWGDDHVALIATFNTYGIRKSIQDVAKIMDLPHSAANAMTKSFSDDDIKLEWDEAYKKYPAFRKEVDTIESPMREDFEAACKAIFGKPSNLGVHAAGVLISANKITDVAPIIKSKKNLMVQYSFEYCERFGLLKMDMLGLRNLDAIFGAAEKAGLGDPIDWPLDDKNTYDLMCSGRLTGMFQIEKSKQFKEVCVRLQPREFDEIVDMLSLYRPGPIENGDLEKYVRRKTDPEYKMDTTIADPRYRSILSETRFCMIYQEQILNLVRELAGYTYSKADLVRRAIGKKDREKLLAEKDGVVTGFQSSGGFTLEDAEKIWSMIETSAEYSWNKAHSAAYGHIMYWTGYLAANHPGIFFAVYCNCDIDQAKQRMYINEAKSRGVKIAPPDINTSDTGFVYKDGTIYYGILSAKGVGGVASKAILKERAKNGSFLSMADFRTRVAKKSCNKAMVQALVQAGAFDSMYGISRRKNLFQSVFVDDFDTPFGQIIEDYDELWLRVAEASALGIVLSVDPLKPYMNEIKSSYATNIHEALHQEGQVRIAGTITNYKKVLTKKKRDPMAFGSITDQQGEIVDFVIFPKTFAYCANWIGPNEPVIIIGDIVDEQGHGAGTANLRASLVQRLGSRIPVVINFNITTPFQAMWFNNLPKEKAAGCVEARAIFPSSDLQDSVEVGQRYAPMDGPYQNFQESDYSYVYEQGR